MSMSAPDPAAAADTNVLHLAVDHHRNGRLDEAEALYRQILAHNPDHADALHLLGLVAGGQGRLDAAIDLIEQAIARRNDVADYHNNLGGLLKRAGRAAQAVAAYRRALTIAPGAIATLLNLAQALRDLALISEAEQAVRQAIERAPDNARAHYDLGVLLQRQGKIEEAIACFERVLALAPDHADAHFSLGAVLHGRDRLAAAERCYRRALECKPGHVEALNNLGENLKIVGRFAEAIACFRRAIALDPRRAWPRSNLLLSLNYDIDQTPERVAAEHRSIGALWEQEARRWAGHARDRDSSRPLRVGLVSGDFRNSSCAPFIQALIAALDPREIDLACYSHVARPDSVTAAMQRAVPRWRNVLALDPDQLAAEIDADRIDILVDLGGHTRDNRLAVFARKPAPVQISWLGYPNTTGLAAIDGRLTDEWADPIGEADRLHTERLIRLPRCFLCYAAPADAPAASPADRRGITFGSFNNANKVNSATARLWTRIIDAVPDSRLLLKAQQFKDAETAAAYRALFAAAGLSPDRLELRPWAAGQVEHLSAYRQIDIALDPFPYNGTATTCEALWMGVPVVSLAGRAHAGRVGLSLLRAVGLSDLVADDAENYVATAVRLALDRPRVAALRSALRPRMAASELCDGPGFGRAVTAALRASWRAWCAGAPSGPPSDASVSRR